MYGLAPYGCRRCVHLVFAYAQTAPGAQVLGFCCLVKSARESLTADSLLTGRLMGEEESQGHEPTKIYLRETDERRPDHDACCPYTHFSFPPPQRPPPARTPLSSPRSRRTSRGVRARLSSILPSSPATFERRPARPSLSSAVELVTACARCAAREALIRASSASISGREVGGLITASGEGQKAARY